MELKNCNNCNHNIQNVCENTNWKDGSKIVNPYYPQCGYMTNTSKSPTGFSKIKNPT